jgi:hypothetical protein
MSDGDPRQALDEARRCFDDLRRILDAAEHDAAFSSASDSQRITAAKAATERGAAVLEELGNLLLPPGQSEAPPS